MRPRLANLRREELHVLCLSTSSHLLRHARVAEGSATECHVDPREVFAPAIACRAAAVVLVHNHPSGDPQPSASDLALTRQLAEAGRTLCIRLVDHVVLADGGGFVSIASHALPTLPAP
jgi:DNA repair protein RadC